MNPPGLVMRASSSRAWAGAWPVVNTPTLITASKGVGVVPQLLPKGHLAELFVEVLSTGLLQHAQREVNGVEILVPQLRKTFAHESGPCSRVEYLPSGGDMLGEQVGRCLRSVPGKILSQVFIVFRSPLVVTLLQLLVGGGGVHPLDPVVTVWHVTSGR